jgi:regulator of sigma E protease
MLILAGILVGLVVLTLLVVIHELGHALVARRNGVAVEEFGIGFPPRAKAWKVKKSFLGKNVEYSVNWLPIGGFVRLQGESDDSSKKGDYGRASFWQKTKILLAGVVMNWLTAAALFTILALFGIPKMLPNQFSVASDTVETGRATIVTGVTANSPAAEAGLKSGDTLESLAGKQISGGDSLSELTKSYAGQKVDIVYQRDNTEQTVTVMLNSGDEATREGYLGVHSGSQLRLRSTWSAPIVGVGLTAQFSWETLKGLGGMVSNLFTGVADKFSSNEKTREQGSVKLTEAGNSVTGPVGLLGVILPQMLAGGIEGILLIAAVIAVSLAVMNILPIPALDGGRWFLTFVYRIILRKPLKRATEEKINGYGMMFLLGLILLITIVDIGKIIG